MSPTKLTSYQDGVPELIAAHGIGEETAEALLSLDVAMFHSARRAAKGEWVAAILSRMDADLEMVQFQALTSVARRCTSTEGGRVTWATVGDLAEDMQITPSRASRLAAELVTRGYLRRGAAQDDGRKSYLELTPKASRFLERFRSHKWDFILSIYDSWEEEDIRTFARLYGRYTFAVQEKLTEEYRAPATS
ncbi:MarR family winged helix-turn-helix transcriptional regulator [Pseudoroseicyclus sp. H15]